MYGVVPLTTQERLYKLSLDIFGSGRRPDALLKKWGFEYRKGKTSEDIQKAVRLTYARNKDGMLEQDLMKRLHDIVKSVV